MSKVIDILSSIKNDPKIHLLNQKEVLQWIHNDLTFLYPQNETKPKAKVLKTLEDNWGRSLMKERRPDLNGKQWSSLLGQYIVEEALYLLLSKNKISTQPQKENFRPDFEVDDAVIEVKTQSYFTTGTAEEKILGCPLKYADIPELFQKPLKIICVGHAEVFIKSYLRSTSRKRKSYIEFFKDQGTEFICLTDIFKSVFPE